MRWLEAAAAAVRVCTRRKNGWEINAMRESRIFLFEGKQGKKWLEPLSEWCAVGWFRTVSVMMSLTTMDMHTRMSITLSFNFFEYQRNTNLYAYNSQNRELRDIASKKERVRERNNPSLIPTPVVSWSAKKNYVWWMNISGQWIFGCFSIFNFVVNFFFSALRIFLVAHKLNTTEKKLIGSCEMHLKVS